MSFIGPRPPIIDEVKQYELKHLKRISVKPGITGLWQVSLNKIMILIDGLKILSI